MSPRGNGAERGGFAGKLAQGFVRSKLTPVLALASILLGIGSVWVTPKEEEPQISVPMIDIQTRIPGLQPPEVERQVTEVIERAVWGLEGVEYVYSSSQAHGALTTVRFKVGEPMEPSLVKVHHKLLEIRSELPPKASAPEVKSWSINDVPFLALTFSSASRDDYSLRTLLAPLARELSATPDVGRLEIIGGLKRSVRVIADPVKLQARGVSLLNVADAIRSNDALVPAGKTWGTERVFDVEVGGKIRTANDVEAISVGQRGGALVRVGDVAHVEDGPEERTRVSKIFVKDDEGKVAEKAAVTLSFAKRKGTNAVTLAKQLTDRAMTFAERLPTDVKMNVIRDYGATAAAKSEELIEHLLLATLSVSVLIALAMGIRASLVVATAIPVTLALTLAIYAFLGYTLNRVTLFALIFSIGILVDDAIVVVENVERHFRMEKEKTPSAILRAVLRAVSEVGNPTILATFTVIAAILPMAFVRGLMGPYMRPIPVGASLAMILSLLVAFIVTPWAAVRLLKAHGHGEDAKEGRLDRLYRRSMGKLLSGWKPASAFGMLTVFLLLAATALLPLKLVKVKMLPFDDKDEFQILADYEPTTPLAKSAAASEELARRLLRDPEVRMVQVFAGEPAPFSFSGMVKHTFLRRHDSLNDFQVVLTDKDERKVDSHRIIERLRPVIASFGKEQKALTRVLEIPPGPPVLATMLAEVYGPDREMRKAVGEDVLAAFASEPSVVDLDYSWREQRPTLTFSYDQKKGGLLDADASRVAGLGRLIFSETPLALLGESASPEEVSVDLSLDQEWRSSAAPFAAELMPSPGAGVVSAADVLDPPRTQPSEVLFRKNLQPVSYVMSELSGAEEAPVYGILKLAPKIKYPTQTAQVPWNTRTPVIKWDGEWFITYEVFRDLGVAFAAVMILIYVLVLGWFRSFAVPLVIMAPIPISLIGILPGHALLGTFFTATSMIGFIAGAGIIVRNSIILVDFIERQLVSGMPLKEAVISAGVLRFRPMLLTAAAVVVGSAVMLTDPIFQGLAVSLISGEVAATILSRFAVPILYAKFIGRSRVRFLMAQTQEISKQRAA